MENTLALWGVLLAGLYLVGLAALCLIEPARARQFLQGFAGSPSAHYFEMALRLAVGGAFVLRAPHMMFPEVFSLFGWVLVVTTACLLALPWHQHQCIARHTVPRVLQRLSLVGLGSLALGSFILVSATFGLLA